MLECVMDQGEQTPERVLGHFVSALRRADLGVSPAETLDAVAALDIVGYDDPRLFRDTLSLVLAKTVEEKAAFDICFDRFFSARQFRGNSLTTLRESLSDMTMQGEGQGAPADGDAPVMNARSIISAPHNECPLSVSELIRRIDSHIGSSSSCCAVVGAN